VSPARAPRDPRDQVRLLVIEPDGSFHDDALAELPELLAPGDVLVVNDAATLPASFHGAAAGRAIELRLAAHVADDTWQAVLFGAGDWRTPTEKRAAPPALAVGERIELGRDGVALGATVLEVSALSARLVTVRFDRDGAELLDALYRLGAPIQYAYLEDDLPLYAVQTAFAGRPWAVELPSAGRPLSWHVLEGLKRRGVEVATVTHAAGLSSTGDAALDAALPLPERYEVPASTLWLIAEAKSRGSRVIAAGTTVVRALEASAAAAGSSLPLTRRGVATLRIGPEHRLAVVDGILTGMHVAGESHFELLGAFAPRADLERAAAHAAEEGYLGHEFGDATLLLPRPRSRPKPALRVDEPGARVPWSPGPSAATMRACLS
jgi:S-adenosylmethionine:tRNA ribosyltransferase-isomerase